MKALLIAILFLPFSFSVLGQKSLPDDSNFTGIKEINGMKVPFVNGRADGIARSYFSNGKVAEEITYKDGKLQYTIPYGNGDETGVAKEYYENGNVKTETTYVEGSKNGVAKWYYENGKLECQATYYNDSVKNGVVKDQEVDEDGDGQTYRIEIPYKDGKIDGLKKWYSANGKLVSEIAYAKGVEGATKYYNGNGKEIK